MFTMVQSFLNSLTDALSGRSVWVRLRHPCRFWIWAFLFAVLTQAVVVQAETSELPVPAQPGRFVLTTVSGGISRTAHIHIPAGYKLQSPLPLVLVLHGAGGNGRVVLDHDRWAASAEQNEYLVVAPDGLPGLPGQPPNFRSNPSLWNSGQLNSRSPRTAIDDVAYIRQLLDELKVRLEYDTRRVYCCGHSNGGAMTFRLAASLSERFAAIGTVAGTMALDDPQLKHPMPTLCIFGTKDPLMPLDGGEVQLPWGIRRNPPVFESLSGWAKALGCETRPTTLSNIDGVEKLQYASKSTGPSFTVLLIEGHGHLWPGNKSFLPERIVGPATARIDATQTFWKFFRSTSLPEVK